MSSAVWNAGRKDGVTTDPLKGEIHSASRDYTVFIQILVDWLETDEAHIFKANLPGLRKDDVKVQVEGGVMHIAGERKKDEVGKNDKWHCLERSQGTFFRHIRLSENAILDQVKVNMTNGVLTVTVPKTAESKVMPIEISEN